MASAQPIRISRQQHSRGDRSHSAATFETIERQLRIECGGNGYGGIAIQGVAKDQVADGNVLRFEFGMDQTFLPAIISDLRDIEAEFPNRVHPDLPQ